jgi:hypothetical protein
VGLGRKGQKRGASHVTSRVERASEFKPFLGVVKRMEEEEGQAAEVWRLYTFERRRRRACEHVISKEVRLFPNTHLPFDYFTILSLVLNIET